MMIVWSRRALRHLVYIRHRIEKDSGQNAALVASRILEAVELLQSHPEIGRPGRVVGTRELVVLQRASPEGSGHWRRVAAVHADEAGHYAITHTFKRPGEVVVRALVRSRGALVLAASAPLTYTIAPRPALGHAHSARRTRAHLA